MDTDAVRRLGKPFVVVSGLPGSGKTTLARRLAPMLDLPVIDKDEILERLFEARGIGDVAWRRTLSRESDTILQHEAVASDGAILTSFWHLLGMPADSGTPTDWLTGDRQHPLHLRSADSRRAFPGQDTTSRAPRRSEITHRDSGQSSRATKAWVPQHRKAYRRRYERGAEPGRRSPSRPCWRRGCQ